MDCLKQLWACLTCSWKGECGKMMTYARDNRRLHCPRCDSADCSPADGAIVSTPEWYGETPAMLN